MNATMKHTLYGVGAGLLTVTLGAGVLLNSAAFAADANISTTVGQMMKGHKPMDGKAPFVEALGLTDAEVTALKNDTSGKTVAQLLAEKNISKDDLKAKELAKITERFTTEFDQRFETMKDKKVSELLTFKEGVGHKGGRGEKMGGMQMTDDQIATKLGISADEVKKARDAGTLQDLMQKHRETMKAQNANKNK